MATLLLPPPRRRLFVPKNWGFLSVNWSHPLANGLIGCWVPGRAQGYNLAGYGPYLTPGASVSYSVGIEGPGLLSNAANTYLSGTAPSIFTSGSTWSLYWRGTQFGNGLVSSSDLIGVNFNSSGGTPFDVYGLLTFTDNTISAKWNSAGTSTGNSVPAVTNGGANTLGSYGATFNVAGNVLEYSNGSQVNTTVFGSAPTVGVNPPVIIGTFSGSPTASINGLTYIACIWNRILTAAEMVQMHVDPYGVISQPEWGLDTASVTGVPLAIDPQGTNAVFRRIVVTGY